MKRSRILELVSLTLLSFSILLPLVKPNVVAQSSDLTPEREARIFQATQTLIYCDFHTPGYYQSRNENDIDGGNIFEQPENAAYIPLPDEVKHPGYIVDGVDGRISCNDGGEINKLYDILEVSGGNFLIDVGIYGKQSTGSALVIREGDKEKRKQLMINYIKNNYGVDVSKSLSKPAGYAALRTSFDSACDNGELAESQGGNKVVYVTDQGEQTTKYYSFKTSDSIPIGQGFPEDGGDDWQMQCKTIAEAMESRAGDYKARIDSLIEQGVDTSFNSTSQDTATSCSEQFGISFGWVVCQMLEAIGSTVGFIFNFVDGMLNIDGQIISSNDQLRAVWSYFRAIATFLLIIVGLVMIISQAVGGNR